MTMDISDKDQKVLDQTEEMSDGEFGGGPPSTESVPASFDDRTPEEQLEARRITAINAGKQEASRGTQIEYPENTLKYKGYKGKNR